MARTFEELQTLAAGTDPVKVECVDRPVEPANGSELPEVLLQKGNRTILATGSELGSLLAEKKSHFIRGGTVIVVRDDLAGDPNLVPVKASALASDFESVARLCKEYDTEEGVINKPVICSKAEAEAILNSETFQANLPRLTLLSRSPVITEFDNKLVEVIGYHDGTGILAGGTAPSLMFVEEAVELLKLLLIDFRFAGPSDRSRALAGLITPALVFGRLLSGRAPVDLGEADQSQAGKGYRNKVTSAIYGYLPTTIAQQTRGVGSLEESFDHALISGRIFISIDNVRGKLDSPKIESFVTEDIYLTRCPYLPVTEIDPTRVYLMLTSNKADLTTDFANRCSCVRILKQPDGYQYRPYPEGGLLDHVKANQPKYLGAVFTVVRAWYQAGRPQSRDSIHDFREWARTLDWILQEVFHEAPLLTDHRLTQLRMSSPNTNWLRDVSLAVMRSSKGRDWLRTSEIVDIMADDGSIEIPGIKSADEIGTGLGWNNANQQTGRRLKGLFKNLTTFEIDGIVIERRDEKDSHSRPTHAYRFVRTESFCGPANKDKAQPTSTVDNSETEGPAQSSDPEPAIEPADSPLSDPLTNSRESANPANEFQQSHENSIGSIMEDDVGNTTDTVSGLGGNRGHEVSSEEFVFE